jgi:hypothetical protein
MYEVPEVHVLGKVSEMTLGKRWGFVDDGLPDRLYFIPANPDELESEANA